VLITSVEDEDSFYRSNVETVMSTSGKRFSGMYQHLAWAWARGFCSDEEQSPTRV